MDSRGSPAGQVGVLQDSALSRFRGHLWSRRSKGSVGFMKRIDASDEKMMAVALDLARIAADAGETPVGAVVVQDGRILGSGYNQVEAMSDPTAHAEIVALREASRASGDWRLPAATVYVTLEPCIMCAAAMIHARVQRVVYGARDHRWGAVGSLFDFSHDPRLNHELQVVSGVLEDDAARLLREFYRKLRQTPS
jgi:tRNA(adenine34) deaminase